METAMSSSEAKPAKKKRAAAATKKAPKEKAPKAAAKKRAAKAPKAAKAGPGKTVHVSGKEKNRFALNIWVTAAQKKALKSLAKSKGTSIVGMLRHALKLPE